jgi:lipoprotein-releasing system ATP-binding protein
VTELAAGTVTAELRGVSKSYSRPTAGGGETIPVLTSAELAVRAGERVAIQGQSGVGKTTVLNLLGGLDRADAGEVLHLGRPIPVAPESRARWRRMHVGFIFQFHGLLAECTALENVLLGGLIAGLEWSRARGAAVELLDALGLAARLEHYPDQLSGGEQQRVSIARALVKRPRLVLADEPTGNLDPRTGDRVLDTLIALQQGQGCSLVVATHSARLAARCHRIVRVDAGRLVPVAEDAHNFPRGDAG